MPSSPHHAPPAARRQPGAGLARLVARFVARPGAFVLLVLVIALPLLFGHRQEMTGDEQRYLLYAESFFRHGRFVMPVAEWNRIAARLNVAPAAHLPSGGGGVVMLNSVYVPLLLSPVAGVLSLWGLRLVALAAGVVALLALWRLLRRAAGPVPAFSGLALSGLSIPLLPYLHLFYMETFLVALVCWGWLRLQHPGRSLGGDLLTASILLAVPFVHLRGTVVMGCLFAALLHRTLRRGLPGRAALLSGIAVLAAGLLITLNLWLYGAVTGPVNTARPPLPWQWFPVLSMQLFNVRHGLLAYAPIWTLGYAGLCYGAWRNVPLARQALGLATVAALTGVGENPGECWPARFWVLSVPMLAVGLGIWFDRVRGRVAGLVAAILLVITLANTVLFIRAPNAFIENRQTSTTYAHLFKRYGGMDANAVLPVELPDPANRAAARELGLGAVVFVALMALALHRRAAAWPALLMLLVLFDLARVQRVPAAIASVTATPSDLRIVLRVPLQAPILRIGNQAQPWFQPASWLGVTASGAERASRQTLPASPLVTVACRSGVRSIDIRSDGIDLAAERAYGLAVDRSASLLRGLFRPDAC